MRKKWQSQLSRGELIASPNAESPAFIETPRKRRILQYDRIEMLLVTRLPEGLVPANTKLG